MSRLAVIIVTWNSARHLPFALRSLNAQTRRDFSVVVVDNASDDETADIVRSEMPTALLLRNAKNLGFARGNNQGLAYVRAHLAGGRDDYWVLLMNDDVVLSPDYLENLLDRVERRPEVGSATGIVYRAVTSSEDAAEPELTERLDTAGLAATRGRRFFDRGAGSEDREGCFSRQQEIFGVSGCLALCRWGALEDACVDGQWLDEDFFMYKEDVDLAWRLRLLGWTALFVPDARAWHFRTASGGERLALFGEIRRRAGRSRSIQARSFCNHLLTIVKNDRALNFLRDLPFIAVHEALQVGYLAVFRPRALFAGATGFLRLLPRTLGKRRRLMRRAKAKAREMGKWFRNR